MTASVKAIVHISTENSTPLVIQPLLDLGIDPIYEITGKYDMMMLTELTLQADEINANPELAPQIYQEVRDKVNNENMGLLEWCVNLRDWVYEQIRM